MTGLWCLHSALLLITIYQHIQFHLFIFNTFIDMLQTIIAKIREITVITCDRVMVLALYTSSDDILSMNYVLFNSLLYFQRYAPEKLNIAKN